MGQAHAPVKTWPGKLPGFVWRPAPPAQHLCPPQLHCAAEQRLLCTWQITEYTQVQDWVTPVLSEMVQRQCWQPSGK